MKIKINLIVLSVIFIASLSTFTSCKKSEVLNPSNNSTKDEVTFRNDPPPTAILYVDLHIDLISNGWTLTSLPIDFVAAYPVYSNVYRYTRGSDVAYIYKFATPAAALEAGDNTCISKWHSNTPNGQNACYNPGNECTPTSGGDGTIIVVCC